MTQSAIATGPAAPPAKATNKVPRIEITSFTVNDGKTINLNPNDVVLVVGPNNAGKSVLLRDIEQKLANPSNVTTVLPSLTFRCVGTPEEFADWLEKRGTIRNEGVGKILVVAGSSVVLGQQKQFWKNAQNGLHHFLVHFCSRLTTEGRLGAAHQTAIGALTSDPLTHPLHYVYRNYDLELALSQVFRRAFDTELILNRFAGSVVALHVGCRPPFDTRDQLRPADYARSVEALPRLDEQGDGMRSFAGVMLYALTMELDVLIVDEPDAFLHPPQARLLGHILAGGERLPRQLILATHSGDFLRGAISANAANLRILRISRDDNKNYVHELNQEGIKEFWEDPLLRQSNALDGVFHTQTIVCEADGDCRFFGSMADAVWANRPDEHVPDVMFTHCGGKHRIPVLIAGLRALSVPVRAVADFDVLREEQPLRTIVEAFGVEWSTVSPDWNIVKKAVDQKKPEFKTDEVKKLIAEITDGVTTTAFPDNASKRIREVLRKSSPWSIAKETGKAYVPQGDASEAFGRLVAKLRSIGLHVLEIGQIESFCRTVGNHGPEWVNEVLKRDLINDPELREAREFVTTLLS